MATETKSAVIRKSLFGFGTRYSDAVEPAQPYFGDGVVTKRWKKPILRTNQITGFVSVPSKKKKIQ